MAESLSESGVGARDDVGEFASLAAFVPNRAIAAALRAKAALGGSLGLNLVRVGAIDEALFASYAVRRYDLTAGDEQLVDSIHPDATRLLPGEIVHEGGLLPLRVDDDQCLLVGVVEPVSAPRIEEAEFFAGLRVEPRVVTMSQFRRAFERVTGHSAAVDDSCASPGDCADPLGCLQCAEGLEPTAADWVARHLTGSVEVGRMVSSERPIVTQTAAPTPPPLPSDELRQAVTAAAPAVLSSDGFPGGAGRRVRFDSGPQDAMPAREDLTPIDPVPAIALAAAQRGGALRPVSAPLAAEAVSSGEHARPAPARRVDSEGVFGPPNQIVDRMGHPSVFTRSVVRNTIRALAETTSADETMAELAAGLAMSWPTALVFSVRAGQLVVWHAAMYRRPRNVVGFRFDIDGTDPWDRVVREGASFRGRLGPSDPLRQFVGRDLGRDTLIVPIAIRQRTIALVVLDCGYETELAAAGGQWEALETAINDALVRILRQRRPSPDA